MRKLLFAALLLASPFAAYGDTQATDWTIFAAGSDDCESAPFPGVPATASPTTLISFLRSVGITPEIQSHNDSQGNLLAIEIKYIYQDSNEDAIYFMKPETCALFKGVYDAGQTQSKN